MIQGKIYNSSSIISSYETQLRLLESSTMCDIILTKTCTLHPRTFTDKFYKSDEYGAINCFGLANPGFDYYTKLSFSKPFIISVTGSFSDLQQMFSSKNSAYGYEINVSCCNVNKDAIPFMTLDNLLDNSNTHMFTRLVVAGKKFGIKIPPLDENDFEMVAEKMLNLKARFNNFEWITCCNTKIGMIDGKVGGISGKYLKPFSLYTVYRLSTLLHDSGITIVGCGGIDSEDDIRDYKKAGASSFQIGTSLINNVFAKGEQGIDDCLGKLALTVGLHSRL